MKDRKKDRQKERKKERKKERNKERKKERNKQTKKDGRKEKEKEKEKKKKKKAGVLHNRTVTMLRTATCSPISATKWSVRGSVQVGQPTHQAAKYKI